MIALDTNVLLRLLLQDDSAQTQAATTLIEEKCVMPDSAFVSLVVLCEVFWVLANSYEYSKKMLLHAMITLLNTREIKLEQEEVVEAALSDYTAGSAGFSDYIILHVALAHGAQSLYSFDRKLSKNPKVKWVA